MPGFFYAPKIIFEDVHLYCFSVSCLIFYSKRKKRKKESGLSMTCWLIKQGFSKKYYPEDGDFFEKLVLDLAV